MHEEDFLGFTLREIFSIDRGIAFTSLSLSFSLSLSLAIYLPSLRTRNDASSDDRDRRNHHHPWRRLHFRLSSSVTTRNDKLRFHGGNGS